MFSAPASSSARVGVMEAPETMLVKPVPCAEASEAQPAGSETELSW